MYVEQKELREKRAVDACCLLLMLVLVPVLVADSWSGTGGAGQVDVGNTGRV